MLQKKLIDYYEKSLCREKKNKIAKEQKNYFFK